MNICTRLPSKVEFSTIEQMIQYSFFQIYDECTFSADSMIAHATRRIPDEVINKDAVVDEWWPLSGQEGHEKEGAIHMV